MGGLGYESQAGEIGTVSSTARHHGDVFFRSCVAQALSCGGGPCHRYTLRRNTASIMKIRLDLKLAVTCFLKRGQIGFLGIFLEASPKRLKISTLRNSANVLYQPKIAKSNYGIHLYVDATIQFDDFCGCWRANQDRIAPNLKDL